MAKSKHYYVRKVHRYLGLILGVQFLLWTIGGLYFSWSNMDEIHGDFEKKNIPLLSANITLISPTTVIDSIRKLHKIDSIISIQLIEILGSPTYQIRCISGIHNKQQHSASSTSMNHLADAVTGIVRPPLTEQEAISIAKMRFAGDPVISKIEYLTTTDGHHEYRENPLPAYAVTFNNKARTTVYVAAELGTVQKFRNDKWRIFDFLWMMHTMDYRSRDHIGNWLLRAFSIFGLLTIGSGFLLFFMSSKWRTKKKVGAS